MRFCVEISQGGAFVFRSLNKRSTKQASREAQGEAPERVRGLNEAA